MTTVTDLNEKAIDAFMARKIEIDELLAAIQAASDDHFGTHPDQIHWGHAGNLSEVVKYLRNAADWAK